MYCNCKDITGLWSPLNQRIFQILETLYREQYVNERKRDIPFVEIIRQDAELHGNNINREIDLLHGGDLFYIQINSCRCKNHPLIRLSQKCLELSDEQLAVIISQIVKKIKEGDKESFTLNLPSIELIALSKKKMLT